MTGTLALVGSTGHSVVSTGGNYLLNAAGRTIDMDCATFDLDASGAVQIQGGSDSSIQVISADLDIDTVTSGDININSAADLDLDGATVSIDSAGALSLDAGAASNLSTSVGALTLSGAGGLSLEGNGSEIDITTADAMVDINAGSFDLDTTGNIDMDGVVSTLNGSTALVLKNGSAAMQVASSAFTDSSMASYSFAPSGAFDVTAGASSTVNVTGTLALVGSTGHSVVSTGGTYLLNAAGQTVDIDAQSVDLDCTTLSLAATSGGFAVDATGASRVQTTGANLNLNTVSSGQINLDSASHIKLDPASGSFSQLHGFTSCAGDQYDRGQIGIYAPAKSGVNIAAGEMCFVDQGGYNRASADGIGNSFVSGCAYEAISGGSNGRVATLAGSFIKPIFDTATQSGGADAGKRVYLSPTAGKVTFTPPNQSGEVVYQVGYCVSSDGSTNNNYVAFFPQFIIENP